MEREILLTGVGGQSVQLAALVLARAAAREDRHVMTLGTYGGTMRGGPTESTLVVADAPILSPPIVSHAWAGLVMHPQFGDTLRRKLRPEGLLVRNASLCAGAADHAPERVFDIPATAIATEAGNALGASMVLIGAFSALTGLLSLSSLVAAMHDSVPSYRRQHLEHNERALEAGFTAAPRDAVVAFPAEGHSA